MEMFVEHPGDMAINYGVRTLLWDKHWKSCRRCLDKFALGRSRGKSDFPEGSSPRKSLITRGTSRGQICQTMPKAFPLLVRLQAKKIREALDFPLGQAEF